MLLNEEIKPNQLECEWQQISSYLSIYLSIIIIFLIIYSFRVFLHLC